MKEKTKIDLFNYYFGYWVVKLKLDKKYKFIVKKDNRINEPAYIKYLEPNTYLVKFNTKALTTRWRIISYLLHELGHLMYDFRSGDDIAHEYRAELFALKTIKKYYPDDYEACIDSNKKTVKSKDISVEHKEGWTKAMKDMGEL